MRNQPLVPAGLSLIWVALAALSLGACDGAAGDTPLPDDTGDTPAALPETGSQFRILRGRGANRGAAVAHGAMMRELDAADAACLGETHDDPDDHAVQLMVLQRLLTSGRRMAVGMEMFQKQFQPVLDEYAAGGIDEPTFLARTQWMTRWGFDYGLYRPLVRSAVDATAALLALNAPRELTRKVSMGGGLDALTPEERAQIPELDTTDAEHRAWFDSVVDHGLPDRRQEDLRYLIQVIWDETMADTAWRWLEGQGMGARQIAILAGWGHCMDLGIPKRMRRRGAQAVLSVRAVEEGPDLEPTVAAGYWDFVVAFTR